MDTDLLDKDVYLGRPTALTIRKALIFPQAVTEIVLGLPLKKSTNRYKKDYYIGLVKIVARHSKTTK